MYVCKASEVYTDSDVKHCYKTLKALLKILCCGSRCMWNAEQ